MAGLRSLRRGRLRVRLPFCTFARFAHYLPVPHWYFTKETLPKHVWMDRCPRAQLVPRRSTMWPAKSVRWSPVHHCKRCSFITEISGRTMIDFVRVQRLFSAFRIFESVIRSVLFWVYAACFRGEFKWKILIRFSFWDIGFSVNCVFIEPRAPIQYNFSNLKRQLCLFSYAFRSFRYFMFFHIALDLFVSLFIDSIWIIN